MGNDAGMELGRMGPSIPKILKDGRVRHPRGILTQTFVTLVVVKVNMDSPLSIIEILPGETPRKEDCFSRAQAAKNAKFRITGAILISTFGSEVRNGRPKAIIKEAFRVRAIIPERSEIRTTPRIRCGPHEHRLRAHIKS